MNVRASGETDPGHLQEQAGTECRGASAAAPVMCNVAASASSSTEAGLHLDTGLLSAGLRPGGTERGS